MAPIQLIQEAVHPDTQAVLLLCGAFTSARANDAKPLSLREYNEVALWLNRQGRRPADLLVPDTQILVEDETGLPQATRLRALLGRGVQMAAALERWQRLGLWVMSRAEASYPERLWRTLRSAAPALLYGAGDPTRLNRGGLAVVGSRDIDEEGLAFTRRVSERCTQAGMQIISGGARGVDQAAVSATLEAGGGAVAVLADRLDRTATSRAAKGAIREGALTLVTPYEPEAAFTVGSAMGRNKHIYALAEYALVVRFTTDKGGTWTGAVEQLRANKPDAIAIPVFVRVAHNPAEGCRQLLSRGAIPFPEEAFWLGHAGDVLQQATLPTPVTEQPLPAANLPVDLPAANGEVNALVESTPMSEEKVSPSAATVQPLTVQPLEEPVVATPAITPADTCYSRCLPLLLESLRQEPSISELPAIAKRLDIVLAQLKAWIKRACGEGRLKPQKQGRRIVGYLVIAGSEEPNLFDRDGDAA